MGPARVPGLRLVEVVVVPEWSLEVRGTGSARAVELDTDVVTLGRAASCTIVLEDDAVSRLHVVLELDSAAWCVRDAGSSNGTFVNGRRLDGPQALSPNDEIVVGQTSITLRRGDATATTHLAAQPAEPQPAPASDQYLDLTEEWQPPSDVAASRPPSSTSAAVVPASTPEPAALPAAPRSPVAAAPVGTSDSRHGPARLRGIARGIQVRRDQMDRDVLAFRVDRYDASGDRAAPVAVELVGHRSGQIGEGGEVEVEGRWARGTLRAARVRNLSTGSDVVGPAKGTNAALAVVYVLIVSIILVVFVTLIFVWV